MLVQREKSMDERERRLEQREREVSGREQQLSEDNASDDKQLEELQNEFIRYRNRVNVLVINSLRDLAKAERRSAEEAMVRERYEIGRVIPVREGHMVAEMWENGQKLRGLKARETKLAQMKEEAEADKKKLTSLKRSIAAKNAKKDAAAEEEEDGFKRPSSLAPSTLEIAEKDEIVKFRLASIKREALELKTQEKELMAKKEEVIRTQKLLMDQSQSRFSNRPVLNERYLVLNLLGKGGFSEVYKALDLVELRFVACKIHQLNTNWSDERKKNYTRHATREYNIHKALHHERVVQLFDVFAIDLNSFCTVLELCEGTDLDMYLRKRQTINEKEAKCIIMQVFSGLKYLNQQKQTIIHYDLKPGNILLYNGEVKITDFGLSKIVPEEGGSQGIELTSQGAGTYWYLPPECFVQQQNGARPIINSKVDIWSTGIILFQMLYGKKPFGHGMTPDNMLSQKTISNARRVDFPAKPAISQTTKDFIQRCLSHNVNARPDIFTIWNEPYLKGGKKGDS